MSGSAKTAFNVRTATVEDLPQITPLLTSAFHGSFQKVLGYTDDAAGRELTAKNHLQTWQDHENETGLKPAVVATTNGSEGQETVAAFAEWFIYPKPRPAELLQEPMFFISGSWLSDPTARAAIQLALGELHAARMRWARKRGIGILMFVCTVDAFRRQGAATLCVQRGLEECRRLGVPALLEASEMGRPVYEKMGFEVVEMITMQSPSGSVVQFPVMLWWPPGTPEEAKKHL